MELRPSDVGAAFSDQLVTASGTYELHAGCGRFLRAQQEAAVRAGADRLFSRSGKRMDPADFVLRPARRLLRSRRHPRVARTVLRRPCGNRPAERWRHWRHSERRDRTLDALTGDPSTIDTVPVPASQSIRSPFAVVTVPVARSRRNN